MSVVALLDSAVVVLDDDGLLTREASVEEEHNLSGLQELSHFGSVLGGCVVVT